jgi:ATP phosphoribosyltransferase regulatory subunit
LSVIPFGTRYVLPPEWEWREQLKNTLQSTLSSWGYAALQTPALELHDPEHPQSDRAFRLIDRDGSVLSLRSEYTAAISRLLKTDLLHHEYPLRLQSAGQVWLRGLFSELGRLREFTQVDAELIGISSPAADAELLELARDALGAVGVRFRLEVADRSFVQAILQPTGLEETALEELSEIIERKAQPELASRLEGYGVSGPLKGEILQLTDLYGGLEVLDIAQKMAHSSAAQDALERLRQTVDLTGRTDFLFDLGMARRLAYYTGMTFRAYTPDFGQPLLGGGRYTTDLRGTGLPGAGFAIGLERVMSALGTPPKKPAATVLALDFAAAQFARGQGYRTVVAHSPNPLEMLEYAHKNALEWVAVGEQMLTLEQFAEQVAELEITSGNQSGNQSGYNSGSQQ